MTEDECHVRELAYTVYSDFSERTELNKHDCRFSFSSLQPCQYLLFPLESRGRAASFSAWSVGGWHCAVSSTTFILLNHYLVVPPLVLN